MWARPHGTTASDDLQVPAIDLAVRCQYLAAHRGAVAWALGVRHERGVEIAPLMSFRAGL